MGLKIYKSATPTSAFSTDGSFTNPISHAFDGITGQVIEKRYFVRNDDVAKNYTSIQLVLIDGGDNIVNGSGATAGFFWKLHEGDTQPLEEQWSQRGKGNTISLSDISDTNTYVPFWVRIEVPAGASIQSFQSVQPRITAVESL